MPIYVVGARNQRVQIPNQALTVSITGAVGGAALEVQGGPDNRWCAPQRTRRCCRV